MHAVDLDGVFLGCKYAIRHSHAAGHGSIISVSSIAGITAGHNMADDNSAKAAIRPPTFVCTTILDPLVERLGAE